MTDKKEAIIKERTVETAQNVTNDEVISRKAAIDAVKGRYYKYDRIAKLEELVWAINTVPTAQPEIIRCKECKWKNKHNCTRAVEVIIDDDKYCAWAERK